MQLQLSMAVKLLIFHVLLFSRCDAYFEDLFGAGSQVLETVSLKIIKSRHLQISVSSCENGISDSIPILNLFFWGTSSRIFERELI